MSHSVITNLAIVKQHGPRYPDSAWLSAIIIEGRNVLSDSVPIFLTDRIIITIPQVSSGACLVKVVREQEPWSGYQI